MKKLFWIVLLCLMPIMAFSGAVSLPVAQIIPWALPFATALTSTASTITINDDTDVAAFLVEVPKAGTLTQLTFLTGAITTGENAVPIRLETIGTDGNPNGTLIDSPTNAATGTINILSSDDNVLKVVDINSGTGISVAAGQQVAVRIKRNTSGTLDGAVFKYMASILAYSLPSVRDYNIGSAGTWTKTGGSPYLAFNIGGWISPNMCIGGVNAAATAESFATAAERGILINYPVSVRAIGVAALANLAASSSVKFTLYSDPTGTPTQRAVTEAVDTDTAIATSARNHFAMFSTPFTLLAGTNYVLAMSPQDATSLSLNYFPATAAYIAAYPTGSTGTWWARANGSTAFTETNTRIPVLGLIIDQIDTGETSTTGGNNFISQNQNPLKSLMKAVRW